MMQTYLNTEILIHKMTLQKQLTHLPLVQRILLSKEITELDTIIASNDIVNLLHKPETNFNEYIDLKFKNIPSLKIPVSAKTKVIAENLSNHYSIGKIVYEDIIEMNKRGIPTDFIFAISSTLHNAYVHGNKGCVKQGIFYSQIDRKDRSDIYIEDNGGIIPSAMLPAIKYLRRINVCHTKSLSYKPLIPEQFKIGLGFIDMFVFSDEVGFYKGEHGGLLVRLSKNISKEN